MSLESALEEERLEVLKLLENKKKNFPKSEDSTIDHNSSSSPSIRFDVPPKQHAKHGSRSSSPARQDSPVDGKVLNQLDQLSLDGSSASRRRPSRGNRSPSATRSTSRRRNKSLTRRTPHSAEKLGHLDSDSESESDDDDDDYENETDLYNKRLQVDSDFSDESEEDEEDDDESDESSDEDEESPEVSSDDEQQKALKTVDEEGKTQAKVEEKPTLSKPVRKTISLLAPASSVAASQNAPPPSTSEYAAYKRRIIHPSTAFDFRDPKYTPMDVPYTSDSEEMNDARRAALMKVEVSQICSTIDSKRMVRTIERGDLPSLSETSKGKLKSYIVASDLSPEATHALEWTIGTVLRDGNVLMIVCALEDEAGSSSNSNPVEQQQQEQERLIAMQRLTAITTRLLKKTRLQVHVLIEVLHCKSPRHILCEIIDYISPTLVILGSRGLSSIKGVLLGSFSNYIVERSSVPVMVARRKLQKAKNKGLNVKLANNLRTPGSISNAKVD